MTGWFIFAAFVSIFTMKAISLFFGRASRAEKRAILWSPAINVRTLRRSLRPSRQLGWSLLEQSVACGLTLVAFYFVSYRFHFHGLWRTYFAAVPIMLCGLTLGPLVQLWSMPFGFVLPPHHDELFQAKNLSDFWARSWNTWTSDWFWQFLFKPYSRTPLKGLFLVFFVSGLWHEVLIDLPYYLIFHVSLFGTMMGFFLLHFLGIAVDRRFFKGKPLYSRILLWVLLAASLPLIANEALLQILHL